MGRRAGRSAGPRLAMLALAVAAVALRWRFVAFQSGDYRAFLSRWYGFIVTNGHLAALRDDTFSNYDTPYLALLALASYLPAPAIVAIKAISIIGDLALAVIGSRIVAEVRPASAWAPVAAFGIVLFLPTVAMNSGVWAQCDSVYATFCLGSVWSLMRGRPWAASAWFGVALAFKLQAVFLLPVLVSVLFVNRHRLRTLLVAPATFLACLVPALVAGRGLLSQLMVYPLQVGDSSGIGGTVGGPRPPPAGGTSSPAAGPGAGSPGGGAGFTLNEGQSFTHNAPTPYAWLPADASVAWKYGGLVVAAAAVAGLAAWLIARGRRLDAGQVLLLAATTTLVVPLLLPEMHERYFFLAEVLTVLAAFLDWRYVLPALGIQFASTTTYLNYLLNHAVFPLRIAAGAAVAAGVVAAILLVLALGRREPGGDTFPQLEPETSEVP